MKELNKKIDALINDLKLFKKCLNENIDVVIDGEAYDLDDVDLDVIPIGKYKIAETEGEFTLICNN